MILLFCIIFIFRKSVIKLFFWVMLLFLQVIYNPITNFALYQQFYMIKNWFKQDLVYIAQLFLTLAIRF